MDEKRTSRRAAARARLRELFIAVRAPLLLAIGAVVLLIVINLLSMESLLAGPAEIGARILAVAAVGWAVLSIGNWAWERRLRRLQLDVPDNLKARTIATRLRVLRRLWAIIVVTLTVGAALMAIPWARQIGVSIFASAGIAGIAIGIAAQPVLSNLIAGLQIAFTQPIRIEDAVIVEGEWGWIEEIGLFHVVVRLWDLRRLIVPVKYFIDTPFQNWTHRTASIIGSVFWHLDYRAPVEAMREKLQEFVKDSPLWDGKVAVLQVTDANDRAIQVRAIVSARNSGEAWDLRCLVREKMISWLQAEAPEALPRTRAEASLSPDAAATRRPGMGVGGSDSAAVSAAAAEPDRDPTLEHADPDPEPGHD